MFRSMRRVFESVEKTLHTLASHGEAGEKPWDDEPNLYKKDIMICGSHLRDGTDVEIKIEAVRKMGHLAYTGGTEAAKCAGTYLPILAQILKDEASSATLKTEVVKALSELCRAHKDNCDRVYQELDLMPILAKFVASHFDPRLVRWSCYALVVLCASGTKVVRALIDHTKTDGGNFKECLEEMEEISWKGWPRNYAAVLRDFLGHVKVDLNVK
ncbi:uncharacterized protein LOC110980886 [Acanthaster planci]|uniref:Uncharacterized protein LOC110980886 n=1 Tax=Acanthaster planci TaxID=133434 RepID=A0A8B7YK44_ACAPL|nr:uncharacterized protein LOC110980886 [Acanthaster planci]